MQQKEEKEGKMRQKSVNFWNKPTWPPSIQAAWKNKKIYLSLQVGFEPRPAVWEVDGIPLYHSAPLVKGFE